MIAGFYFHKCNVSPGTADRSFASVGCDLLEVIRWGEYHLRLYAKAQISLPGKVCRQENYATSVGMFLYHGHHSDKALDLFLQDELAGKVDWSAISGTYAVLLWDATRLRIYLDSFGVQNLYFHRKRKVLSTAFLPLLDESSTVNPEACLEVLLTGSLLGPDTLIHEIQRVEPDVKSPLPEIMLTHVPPPSAFKKPKSREDALEQSIAVLDEAFEETKPLAQKYGVLSGLTGGLDSRLLLSMALRNWENSSFDVYTNCRVRKGTDKIFDEPLAVAAAKSVGKELEPAWMTHPLDLNEEEFREVTHQSYLFFDGHVRMHTQFFEEYNTTGFKTPLYLNRKMGMSGIGGEQYRNFESMLLPSWDVRYLVRYHLVKNYTANCFIDHEEEESFFYSLETKILHRIASLGQKKLSQLQVKRYYNEILIPSRLGARNNFENRLWWFFSPFIQPRVSVQAYGIIPYLGSSIAFEKDLIARTNTNLAQVPLDYGIRPADALSLKLKLKPFLKELMPRDFYVNKRIAPIRKAGSYQFECDMHDRFRLFQASINEVRELELPIDLDILLSNPDIMPIVYNLGYFLLRLRSNNHFNPLPVN